MTNGKIFACKIKGQKYLPDTIKRIAVNLFLGVILLLMLSAIFNTNSTLFGYKPYFVASESMTPTYKKYAFVVVKTNFYGTVKPGDVIAFRANDLGGQSALHRVVSVTPEGYVTKGDNNKGTDQQVIDRSVFLGRAVWHTNLTSKLIPVLKTPKGIFFMAVLPIAWIVLIITFTKLCRKNLTEN